MGMDYSNTTTARLSGYARKRGLEVGIRISTGSAAGKYFVAAVDGMPLATWRSLGWTKAEAEERICDMAKEEVSDG
jgi:hypothetical protein